MADLIAPRRNEPFVDDRGMLTRRSAEYLEQNTSDVNTTTTDTEVDPSSINLSTGINAQQSKQIDDIEIDLIPQSASFAKLEMEIDILQTQVIAFSGIINRLQKQINDLQLETL